VPLSRVDNLTRSLQDWVVSKLDAIGFSGFYVFSDSYPSSIVDPLATSVIVLSHDTSHPAENIELGGPLSKEPITFIVDVFGADMILGRNLASNIKQFMESGEPIPLNDYSSGVAVEIDKISFIDSAVHNRMKFSDPKPWQQHWNVVAFTVPLEYNQAYLT